MVFWEETMTHRSDLFMLLRSLKCFFVTRRIQSMGIPTAACSLWSVVPFVLLAHAEWNTKNTKARIFGPRRTQSMGIPTASCSLWSVVPFVLLANAEWNTKNIKARIFG